MITIFGTTYFTIGAGLIVLALAAPLLFWFSVWLLRPNIEGKPRSTRWLAVGGTTLALLLLTAVGLFWDVYLIGQRAKELCAETGLQISRTARARSFVGSTDINSWARDGFDFVEDTVRGKRYRFEIREGTELRTEIPEFDSLYEISTASSSDAKTDSIIFKRLMLLTHAVSNRETQQLLGRLSTVTIDYGWIDRLVVASLGFNANPKICGKDSVGNITFDNTKLGIAALLKRTLSPN